MTVTQAAAQTTPSWWTQQAGPSGEADPNAADAGATEESFGFGDFLDVINPLQHIPVVGTIYRELTGDQISETARMAGGAIWGGPAGLIGALANTITEREAGGDIGATALAYARSEETGPSTAPAATLAAAPETGAETAPGLTPPSAAVARFASAEPVSASTLAADGMDAPSAQTQQFNGSAASRLDAFIRQANAVRTPAEVPAQVPVQASTALPAQAQQRVAAAASTRAPTPIGPAVAAVEPSPSDTARAGAPAPLKLAADGNTDVAHWMMRALDRYESMKTTGTS